MQYKILTPYTSFLNVHVTSNFQVLIPNSCKNTHCYIHSQMQKPQHLHKTSTWYTKYNKTYNLKAFVVYKF